MLRQLEERQHFVDNAYMFSLQDLIDVNNGILVEYLTKVHASFASHIKNECLVSCCAVLCCVRVYLCQMWWSNVIRKSTDALYALFVSWTP